MTGMMSGGGLMGAGGSSDTASLLERALRYSPDVQLAEAKLRTAEAELNRARLEVAKSVIGLEHSIASQQRIIDLDRIRVQQAREAYKRAEEIVKKGVAPASSESTASLALKEAESELISAEAKLSELRETLRYIMGGSPAIFQPGMSPYGTAPGSPYTPGGSHSVPPGTSYPPGPSSPPGIPSSASPPAGRSGGAGAGPSAGSSRLSIKLPAEAADAPQHNVRRKLQSPTQIQVKDVEPKELAKYLSDLHGLAVMLDPNVASGGTISIDIRDVPLHAALQAIEDTHPQINFYVRDYGILVHHADVIPDNALTVRDFMQTKGDPLFAMPYGIGSAGGYIPVEVGIASTSTPPGAAGPKASKRQTRVFRLQHASPLQAAEIVQKTIGHKANTHFQVSPDERTGALVVAGDEKVLAETEAILKNLDVPSSKSDKPGTKR
jgi:hypothetical protein